MQLKKTPFVLAVIVCGAGAISVAAQTTSSPYSGTPIALPATASFEASKFDKGGQGVAYKDLTQGNAGGQFRTTEDVDIIASTDAPGGPYAINNFQTGEWLAYTVNVAESKNYDLAIRASSNQTTPAAFHIEVDGANVTGSIAVPKTATWTTFQWVVGKQNVPLTAGKHVLKVVSEQQYFNINAIRATLSAAQPTTPPPAASYTGTPYTGTPIALPKAFEASKFDKGGQNVAYKDLTAGNAGGQFRTTEDVDIIASTDAPGGPYAVNNFQTGEWLAYSVNVPTNGNYDLAIRASSNQTTPAAFHIELDGTNVTGSIPVPQPVNWTTFQWVGKQNVPLTAGKHVVKVVSEKQYFNMSAVSVLASAAPTTPPTTTGGTAPSVALTSPTSAQSVSGMLNYAATVNSAVSKVDFSVSSATPMSLGTKTAAPFGGTLDTTRLENGSHTLTAVATDAQGKTATSQVTFSVQNSVTQVPATKPASLLFWSGFESGVSVGAPRDCYSAGCWQDLLGTDSTTGFSWPPKIGGGGGSYQVRSAIASTPTTITDYIVNDIQTTTGHTGAQTRVARTVIKKTGCSGTAAQDGANCSAQNPYMLQPAKEPGDLYVSYWRKIDPTLLQKLINSWHVVFEWKTSGDYRVIAQIVTYSGSPQWEIRGDNFANGGLPTQVFWRSNPTARVPIGEWFKFEVFWHRSAGSDGRVWMAVNGQTLIDRRGSNIGVRNNPIDRIFLMQLYSGASYPLTQWTDDMQIWSSFPTAKPGDPWYDGVYAPH